ncbi:hypothetical protein C8F01DRAFT_1267554 [Mycena amicta]|nr:hypothetical protein C8F01DRAFT_1267554 [Mycena amicta]
MGAVWSSVPPEIRLEILTLLSPYQLLQLKLVSREVHDAIESESLWLQIGRERFRSQIRPGATKEDVKNLLKRTIHGPPGWKAGENSDLVPVRRILLATDETTDVCGFPDAKHFLLVRGGIPVVCSVDGTQYEIPSFSQLTGSVNIAVDQSPKKRRMLFAAYANSSLYVFTFDALATTIKQRAEVTLPWVDLPWFGKFHISGSTVWAGGTYDNGAMVGNWRDGTFARLFRSEDDKYFSFQVAGNRALIVFHRDNEPPKLASPPLHTLLSEDSGYGDTPVPWLDVAQFFSEAADLSEHVDMALDNFFCYEDPLHNRTYTLLFRSYYPINQVRRVRFITDDQPSVEILSPRDLGQDDPYEYYFCGFSLGGLGVAMQESDEAKPTAIYPGELWWTEDAEAVGATMHYSPYTGILVCGQTVNADAGDAVAFVFE